MYAIKRLMVGIDLTEMDDKLIAYLPVLEEIFHPEVIYFVHVAKTLKLPERVREKYPNMMAPVDESLENDIRKKIEKEYKPKSEIEFRYEIREGDPIREILNWSEIKEVDLIVMGRKNDMTGEGKLANRLARVAHCSIFFVPENVSEAHLKRVIVPIDFSKTSGMALNFAMEMKEHMGCDVVVQNSYEVPSGYSTIGKTYEEFAEIMKKNAREDASLFLKKRDIPEDEVSVVLSLDDEEDPAERAYEEASRQHADLIIIASRGRTGFASILLGSVAEKMIRYNSNIPLLIVKDKKENLGFFQALLRI